MTHFNCALNGTPTQRGKGNPIVTTVTTSSGTVLEIRSMVVKRPVKDKKEIARAKASRHIPMKLRSSQKTENTNGTQDASRGGLGSTTEPDESRGPRPLGSEPESDSSVPISRGGGGEGTKGQGIEILKIQTNK